MYQSPNLRIAMKVKKKYPETYLAILISLLQKKSFVKYYPSNLVFIFDLLVAYGCYKKEMQSSCVSRTFGCSSVPIFIDKCKKIKH